MLTAVYFTTASTQDHFYYSLDWVSVLLGWSIKAIVWGSFSHFCWVSGQEACLRIMTCIVCVQERRTGLRRTQRKTGQWQMCNENKYSQSHWLRSFQREKCKCTWKKYKLPICCCYFFKYNDTFTEVLKSDDDIYTKNISIFKFCIQQHNCLKCLLSSKSAN